MAAEIKTLRELRAALREAESALTKYEDSTSYRLWQEAAWEDLAAKRKGSVAPSPGPAQEAFFRTDALNVARLEARVETLKWVLGKPQSFSP